MRPVIFAVVLTLACSALPVVANAQQIYRWVDEQGITHFGAQPPDGAKASGVNSKVPRLGGGAADAGGGADRPARSARNDRAPMDPEQRSLEAQVRVEVEKEEAERAKFCKDTRMNLAQLRNNPHLNYSDEEGKIHKLDEEERQKRITEAEQAIEDVCQ